MPLKILFVCTGNICRSPLAEALFRHKIQQQGRDADFMVDSAGTHDYHVGERPDPRTLKIADNHHVSTKGIQARQVKMADFEEFDLIFGMDKGHVERVKRLCPPQYQGKIHLFLDYAGQGQADVPDPYYGDFQGFIDMYDLCDAATDHILKRIKM